MKKRTAPFHCIFLFLLSALSLFFFTWVLAADLVSVKNGLLSVNLKDNSLLEVARDIEKQSGVWFRGDETLFQEKISVTFDDLPIEEGLKRILTNLNYSLMFDPKNKVAGVMVMGEGKPAGTQPGRPGATTTERWRLRPGPQLELCLQCDPGLRLPRRLLHPCVDPRGLLYLSPLKAELHHSRPVQVQRNPQPRRPQEFRRTLRLPAGSEEGSKSDPIRPKGIKERGCSSG